MPGLTRDTPIPTGIVVHQTSRELELRYGGDGAAVYRLPFEFLRVYSPSAEVRGHGPGQETLQTGKRNVTLVSLEPVGQYAVQPLFSDGHDTGIYSWDYLYELATQHEQLWQAYLDKLEALGVDRDAPMAAAHGHGHAHGGGTGCH